MPCFQQKVSSKTLPSERIAAVHSNPSYESEDSSPLRPLRILAIALRHDVEESSIAAQRAAPMTLLNFMITTDLSSEIFICFLSKSIPYNLRKNKPILV